jgi:hypothetical protein
MIKRLDRVKLTARAAAVFNNNKRPSMFDWTRVGTSPNRALTVNRDDVFIWLSLFWFVTLCGLVIWMLLSA